MSMQTGPKLAKWPFLLGDALMVGLAYFIFAQHGRGPLSYWEAMLFVGCGLAGALLAALPFVLEYRAAVSHVEHGTLVSTVAEIRNLEMIAAQINAATARWQVVQEHSANSVGAAKEIAQKMTAEAGAFSEFLQKANDGERANLRLEVEKLRRSENDWLQVIVRLLDHTFALYKAAERSGQPGLIEQLGLFQNSCRDVARRVGLVALVPAANDSFDPQCHRLPDAEAEPVPGAPIGETVATGYTYQGRLVRPAIVQLKKPALDEAEAAIETATVKHGSAEEQEEQTLL